MLIFNKKFKRLEHPACDQLKDLLGSFTEVTAGEYSFGREEDTLGSEPPAPIVTAHIPSFHISRRLITNTDWSVIFETDEPEVSALLLPKASISFFEATAFCNAMNDIAQDWLKKHHTERQFALPSEYQWEAAAAGMQALNFPWGNDFDLSLCNSEMKHGLTKPVGTYSPQGDSPFGCSDMAGNLREWTRSYAGTEAVDWQEHTQKRAEAGCNNRTISANDRMVIRGGSYSYEAECVQTWVRNTQIASRSDVQTGFRMVLDV